MEHVTTDATRMGRAGLMLKIVGVLVSPVLFGWLSHLLIGRRLKWHDLKTAMKR